MNYFSRLLLLHTAYRIEYDLRNIIYEHLSRMSFSFYDRVQSGQLISRANSDIRPSRCTCRRRRSSSCSAASSSSRSSRCVTINVPLAFVALSTMPFVFIAGINMRQQMFPVSWLIQARLADVATVVDENIQGVRVVKSFAAENEQLSTLTASARRAEWANVKQADIRAQLGPLIENLPRLGQALVLLYGGYLAINGQATVGDIAAFNAYVLMLVPPFRQLGMVMMMGQRAAASAQRIYEVLDEQPDMVDQPGAVDLVECHGDVHFDDVTFDYANGTPVLDGLRAPSASGRDGRARRAHRHREVHGRAPARRASTTSPAAPSGSTAATSASSPCRACATTSAWSSTSRSCSRSRSATTSPTGDPTRRSRRSRRPRSQPAPTSSSASCPRATTRSSESAASRCRAASASASRSHARCS